MTTTTHVETQVGPFAMVPIWVLGQGLSGSELAVYVALRSYADRSGDAHPQVPAIAARAGVTTRTAERALARLRTLDMIKVTRLHRADGSVAGCNYWLRDVPIVGPDEIVGVPRPSRRGTPTRMSEQEQTNKQTKAPPPTGAPPAGDRPAGERGTRLPADWTPSDALIDWGQAHGITWTPADVDQFRDYWAAAPGARGRKRDWEATWRVWTRRNHQGGPQGHRRPNSAPERLLRAQGIAARLEARSQRRQLHTGTIHTLDWTPTP